MPRHPLVASCHGPSNGAPSRPRNYGRWKRGATPSTAPHSNALALSGQSPSDDLAATRGYSTTHPRLLVHDHIADTLDQLDARADDPHLRRGYARAMQMIADPACPVRGIIAVSRTAITRADRLYEDQLAWLSRTRTGLWLVRNESAI